MASEQVVHVIDDDEEARHSLQFLLECAGLKVRTFASAVAFLKDLERLQQGCIITDVRMPEMTGIELVDRLKELGVGEPVIVITGHADVPMVIKAMRQGVADFIEKPFSEDAILSVVRATLARVEQRDQLRGNCDQVLFRLQTLSQREREVLDGLVEGLPNKTIAYDLGISARTVEVYRANIMSKMQAGSLSELIRLVTIVQLAT
jgi:two-component system response regulator FixJ